MVYALIGVPIVNYAMGMYSILFRYDLYGTYTVLISYGEKYRMISNIKFHP